MIRISRRTQIDSCRQAKPSVRNQMRSGPATPGDKDKPLLAPIKALLPHIGALLSPYWPLLVPLLRPYWPLGGDSEHKGKHSGLAQAALGGWVHQAGFELWKGSLQVGGGTP